MARVFLLSPASCGGERAKLLLRDGARFDLARRIRSPDGAPLGDVFAFVSGLYFRGKLAYARAFAAPPRGIAGSLVITPDRGLVPAERPVTIAGLRRLARTDIDARDPRYRTPLRHDARRLAAAAGPDCSFVLLGSLATRKYLDVLGPVLGPRLLFPAEFVGIGDMSRGSLLLRMVAAGRELTYLSFGDGCRGPGPGR